MYNERNRQATDYNKPHVSKKNHAEVLIPLSIDLINVDRDESVQHTVKV